MNSQRCYCKKGTQVRSADNKLCKMTLSVAEERIAHLLPTLETLDSDIAMDTGHSNLRFA